MIQLRPWKFQNPRKIDTYLKPYNFGIKRSSIRRVIGKLFQVCKLRESSCIVATRTRNNNRGIFNATQTLLRKRTGIACQSGAKLLTNIVAAAAFFFFSFFSSFSKNNGSVGRPVTNEISFREQTESNGACTGSLPSPVSACRVLNI